MICESDTWPKPPVLPASPKADVSSFLSHHERLALKWCCLKAQSCCVLEEIRISCSSALWRANKVREACSKARGRKS